MRWQRWGSVALFLASAGTALLGGCGSGGPDPEAADAPPPSVTVVRLAAEPVTEKQEFVGRVAAAERVELRARVQGFLQERSFTEGQTVSAGDALFRIEPDPYQAIVAQREADLHRAQAEHTNSQAQLRRGEELLRNNDIPRARVDELRAAEAVAEAGIAQAEAALKAARLNLDYTEIRAPIAGRVGLARYTVGNLVGPESGVLATLVQQDPIYVRFPLTQHDLLAHRTLVRESGGDASAAVVHLRLADGTRYEHSGRVDFIDVTVDPGTDTVLIRSRFENPDGLLVAGQYVGVLVESGEPETGVLVPQSSLQVDQTGFFVLVLDDEDRVQVRRVETGPMLGGRAVIKAGLAPGDRVVVEGVQKVRPGQAVTATPWQPPVRD
ncbi:efflux RND transporter periplasmic adaptor subunit [Thioalkalivibrio paradoxus]|uniref:RND transporter MFP subunit n=1 Tax=Thioalkalivibrio paradoxus ARh 1 TaxID=713585 RepID=W0DIS6_9GAMM|nr:efflux RND transporter periplasmic adaptor subunit [Thioalkalivibrio paradoxus]AHE98341.1 RND transporter MFP subunit [Thioalkalivibrio paradoxus ARh 1]